MQTAKRPYWDWKQDRWTLLVAGLLLLTVIWMYTSNFGQPAEVAAPVISAPAAEASLLAGQPGIITGTAAPDAQVRLLDGDVPLGETTADAKGNWRLVVPALSPGTHTLISQVLDENGNVVATSEPLTVTVSEPAAIAGKMPEIKLPAAGLKADTPLVLEGTGTPGTTVQVYDGDQVVGETVVAPDGTWKITLPPLALGAHSLVAKVLGADGREQAASAPLELTVADGQIVVATPAAVAEATAVPAPGAGQAPAIKLPAAGLKAAEPLVLEGTGEPGTTVTLYDGDEVVAETVVGPDGTWTLTVPPLEAGAHSLVAKAVGADGQVKGVSAPLELTVADGQIVVATPAAVAEATAVPAPGAGQAPAIKLPAAGLKAVEPLVLEGTGEPGTTVTLYDGDEVVAETVVGPDGTWTLTVPPLEAGAHSLVAKAVGADGQVKGVSAPLELTVADGQIVVATPAAVAEATAVPAPGAGQAPAIKLPAAGLKAAEPLVLEGTGEPGTTVTLYDGDEVVAETVVGPDGTWTLTVPPLEAGAHSLVAKAVGADGQVKGVSAPLELTVADGQIVVATPAAVAEATAVPAPGAGQAPAIKLPAAGLKAAEPLVLEGTGEPGTTVTLYDGDQVVAETVVGPDGTWTLTVPPLAAGAHSLVAKVLDAAGKEQAASAPIDLTVADGQVVLATPAVIAEATAVPTGAAATTVEPTAEAIAGAATAVATAAAGLPSTVATPGVSAPAVVAPVGATAETGSTMTLEGTGTPGTTVKVYDGDKPLGEAIVGADGKWTMTIPKLAAGAHSLVAKLFGKDGKEQAISQALSVTVPDATGVVLPVINLPAGGKIAAGAEIQLAGTAAPGVLLKLFDGSKLVGQTTADANGNWQMMVPPLDEGEHTLTVITYGPNGEVQASSKPLTVIVTEPEPTAAATPAAGLTPAAPTETSAQPKIGWPPDGSTVVSARPLLTGQSFPHGVVQIFDGTTLLGETLADANGYWTFRPSVALKSGQHVLTAVATSADGTTTAKAPPVTITVRERAVTIPAWKPAAGAAPTVATPANGDLVHTVQPLFAGTAAPNSKVRLYDGDKVLGEAAVDSDGRWTFRPTAPLAEGEHTITVVLLQADGSEGAAKTTVTITVASGLGTAPTQPAQTVNPTPMTQGAAVTTPPVITVSAPKQAAPGDVISGTAPPGSQVQIYEGDTLIGGTTAGANGKWRFRLPANLSAGTHEIHAVVVGPKGTPVSESAPVTIVVSPPRTLPVTGAATTRG